MILRKLKFEGFDNVDFIVFASRKIDSFSKLSMSERRFCNDDFFQKYRMIFRYKNKLIQVNI